MSTQTRTRLASMAAAMGVPFGRMFGNGTARIVGKRMRPITWSKPHQGPQECARRVRQMQRAQAKVAQS